VEFVVHADQSGLGGLLCVQNLAHKAESCGGLTRPWSNPVASLPDEKNKRRDQRNHDKHPVLAFETQKGEMLNKKLHHSRSLFCAE
jgi:hypothetical protein